MGTTPPTFRSLQSRQVYSIFFPRTSVTKSVFSLDFVSIDTFVFFFFFSKHPKYSPFNGLSCTVNAMIFFTDNVNSAVAFGFFFLFSICFSVVKLFSRVNCIRFTNTNVFFVFWDIFHVLRMGTECMRTMTTN